MSTELWGEIQSKPMPWGTFTPQNLRRWLWSSAGSWPYSGGNPAEAQTRAHLGWNSQLDVHLLPVLQCPPPHPRPDLLRSRIMYEDCTSVEGPRRMTGLAWSRSPWWLGCRWMWGFLRARLISFSRRGSGPSLIRASYVGRKHQTDAQHHCQQADGCSPSSSALHAPWPHHRPTTSRHAPC